jgi:hypothetical protein
MHSTPRMSGIHGVIVILKVATPLAPVLDGGAAVFSRAATLELGL